MTVSEPQGLLTAVSDVIDRCYELRLLLVRGFKAAECFVGVPVDIFMPPDLQVPLPRAGMSAFAAQDWHERLRDPDSAIRRLRRQTRELAGSFSADSRQPAAAPPAPRLPSSAMASSHAASWSSHAAEMPTVYYDSDNGMSGPRSSWAVARRVDGAWAWAEQSPAGQMEAGGSRGAADPESDPEDTSGAQASRWRRRYSEEQLRPAKRSKGARRDAAYGGGAAGASADGF